MPHFDTLNYIQLWKTLLEKEKLLVTSNFSFSHNVFYPIWQLFFILKALLKCRLQFVSVWTSLEFCRLVMGSTVVYIISVSSLELINEKHTSFCVNNGQRNPLSFIFILCSIYFYYKEENAKRPIF